MDTVLKINQRKIFNTNLFVTADLTLEITGTEHINIHIYLVERWYIFPVPLFELSDRNFNEWWNTYGRDLSRVNYGMRFVWSNFRGRRERVELLAQFGFTRRFGLQYTIPYLDRRQRYGISIAASYSQNISVAYRTRDNKLAFATAPRGELMRERWEGRLGLTRRDGFFNFHRLELRYRQTWVADSIIKLNPRYFLNNSNTQAYYSVGYQFRRDYRDVQMYALRGTWWQWGIEKNGLGIGNDLAALNTWTLSAAYAQFVPLGGAWYGDTYIKGFLTLQNAQPYSNAQTIGYNDDILRGYELYVIDGQHFVLNRNTLKLRLWQGRQHARWIPMRQFQTIPLAFYLTGYTDMGYVSDQYFAENNTRFGNTWLASAGVGLDVISFYSLVVNLNYTLNRAGERGFFVHFNRKL